MKRFHWIFTFIALICLAACSQGGVPSAETALDSDSGAVANASEGPDFRWDVPGPTKASDPIAGEDSEGEAEPPKDNPGSGNDSGTTIHYIPGLYTPVPQSELDYRLQEYGQSIGQSNLAFLKQAWNECGAHFNPHTHEATLDNELFCFFRETDGEISQKIAEVDQRAGEAQLLYHILITSNIGPQTPEAFADTLNDRVDQLTLKLHNALEQLSVVRSRISKHAAVFEVSLEIINLGDWENSEDYNWVIQEYLKGWLFGPTLAHLTQMYQEHGIEDAMAWHVKQLTETYILLHLSGSFLIGPATDTKNFISYIQFNPVTHADAPYMKGKNCEGAVIPLMGTLDFDYMLDS